MGLPKRIGLSVCGLLVSAGLCLATPVVDLTVVDAARKPESIRALIDRLVDKRVVFIGEDHERYDNHLAQLRVIEGLHEKSPWRWVIGVEYIQRRFQPYLDAYVDGTSSETEFLRQTDYFERWGYDYRLYRRIFHFARDHHIPVVALNAERELTDIVGKVGIAGMAAADRERLPKDIEDPGAAYRERLRKVFEEHPAAGSFDRFVEVQLVWDETMADRVAAYLKEHPDKAMIVLAGEGHIAFRSGIPDRVARRLPGVQEAILLPADKPDADLQDADYLLVSRMMALPPSGKLGITLNPGSEVRVKSVSDGGAAAKAGVHSGDKVVAIDNKPVRSLTDFRMALLDKKPGRHVRMRIDRAGAETTLQLTLQM